MSLTDSLTKRIQALEQQNFELSEKLLALESVFEQKCQTPSEWGLSSSQKKVFAALMGRGIVSKDQIYSALYYDSAELDRNPSIVQVFVFHLRAKLEPYGIKIATVGKQGYRMTGTVK